MRETGRFPKPSIDRVHRFKAELPSVEPRDSGRSGAAEPGGRFVTEVTSLCVGTHQRRACMHVALHCSTLIPL